MIQACIVGEAKQATHRTSLGVAAGEDYTADASVHNRPGTHRARLERNIQVTVVELPAPQAAARLTKSYNFGMRGGVAPLLALIKPLTNDYARFTYLLYDNRSNRYFIFVKCAMGQRQGAIHKWFIHFGQS